MHRYGRHGTKAWLHNRNKRFRKTYLTLSPRIAVLNVPLEFLTRIQKIVIFMQDGSRLEVENNVSQNQLNGQHALSADERYLENASGLGKYSAEKDYDILIDPYAPIVRIEVKDKAYELYLSMAAHGNQFTTWSTIEDAVADYLDHFHTARLKMLDEISGATTKGTRGLIVAAAKDRKQDGGVSSGYTHQIRAIIRAYQSLVSDGYISEELPDEEVLLVQSRATIYHNRYGQNHASSEDDSKEVD